MYTPILATLAYILSPDGKKTLLVYRNKKKEDVHLGKYNGLGGKMKPDETISECLLREIREEAGIICRNPQLRGTVNWKGFGKNGEDWFVFIYKVKTFTGEMKKSNAEGELHWKRIDELHTLPMWEGDKYFLPLVFDSDPRPFHGYMPYENGKPISWKFTRDSALPL